MDAVRVVAPLFAAAFAATSPARPVAESDSDFIVRTISVSPMSPASRVNARLADCSLVIDTTVPSEKKRTVLPLARLDVGSFDVVQDAEWGWFVEVHTRQQQRDIVTSTAKETDKLAEYYIHIFDQKNAQRVRDALVRVVRSCHRAEHRPNQSLEPTPKAFASRHTGRRDAHT
jgi:hypothetical protein